MKFIELTKERHSVRSYTARPVEQEKLDYILECARLAPSAVNKQPWKFMVVQSPEGKSKICQCYAREWMAEAPLYIIVCAVADEAWTRRYDGKNHADIDAAIATEHICLAAADQGLGTCWVCNFDTTLIRQLFPFEPDTYPVAIIPIGYPDETDRPEAKRKPMDEIGTYL